MVGHPYRGLALAVRWRAFPSRAQHDRRWLGNFPHPDLARLVDRESGLPRADWIAQSLLAAAPQMP
jgi:hypothetical protein